MTLQSQYNQFLKHNPDSTFSFNEWMKWHGNQIEQALIQMMQDDEELGLYDYGWCKGNIVLPKEEITLVKKETKELNPYIGPFLLRNGFKGIGGDSYRNSKCTITVLEDCYQINFNYPEVGKVSNYTDSHSIPHLVGVLTWNDLIDKNYKK